MPNAFARQRRRSTCKSPARSSFFSRSPRNARGSTATRSNRNILSCGHPGRTGGLPRSGIHPERPQTEHTPKVIVDLDVPRTHGARNVEPCHGDDHTSQESRPHLRPPHQPDGSVARQIHGDHPRLNDKPSPASVAGSLDTQCHIIDRGHPARTGVYRGNAGSRSADARPPRTHGGLPGRRSSPERPLARPPRTHGGLPRPLPVSPRSPRATPHARGSTPTASRFAPVAEGHPARTGVYPASRRVHEGVARPPRTHGGLPLPFQCPVGVYPAAPHARGSTPLTVQPPRPGTRPPRTHGGLPHHRDFIAAAAKATPHARGSTRLKTEGKEHPAGHPARTGVYPCRQTTAAADTRPPRTHGGLPHLFGGPPRTHGATPHARGVYPGLAPGGHPARTGVYPDCDGCERIGYGPPRTHGGLPAPATAPPPAGRATPHARGSTRQAAPPLHRGDSHPARTGVYRVFTRCLSAAPGPPRTHGGLPTSLRVSTASWGTTPHAQESACAISCASTWVSGPPRTLAGPVRPEALTHVETHAPRITSPPRADRGPPDTKAVQTHRRRGHPARTGVNQIPLRPPRTDGGLPTRTFLHQRRPEATPHARGSTTKWVRVPINIAERPARTRVYRGGRNEMRKFGPPRTHGGLLASRSAARRTQTATPHPRGVLPRSASIRNARRPNTPRK